MNALFFDFDDTLFNTAAFKAAVVEKGLAPSEEEIVRDGVFRERLEELEAAEPGFMAQFLYPGARELVEQYKEQCFIITTGQSTTGHNTEDGKDIEAFQWLKLKLCGLVEVFGEDEDRIRVVHDDKTSTYRELLAQHKLLPQEVICVDDKDSYLRGAKGLELQTIKMERRIPRNMFGLEQVPANPEFATVRSIEGLSSEIESLWNQPRQENT